MKDKEKIDWIVKTINEDLSLQEDSWILFDWEDNGLLEVSVNGINVKNGTLVVIRSHHPKRESKTK